MNKPIAIATCPVDESLLESLNDQVEIRYAQTTNRRISLAEQVADQLAEAHIIVAEIDLVDKATLAAAPNLQLVISCRASPVNVDLDACRERGVPVCTTPGRNADSTADLSFALILDVTRRVTEASMWMRSGQWKPEDSGEPYRRFKGPTLNSRTLGVVGGGAVGQRVAQRGLGFGMEVQVYDPFLTQDRLPKGCTIATLDHLLCTSDVVTLHVPLLEDTIGLINEQRLSQMREGAYLVNASRAAVVVQPALVRFLQDGHLAGVGLDVFADEPPAADDPLLELPNVVVTPHIAGASADVVRSQTKMVAEIISAYLDEAELPYRAREDLVDFRKVDAAAAL
ncbi:NAD(P)-dependent oxidoreductase [Brevibacterium sp. RIT 803]|uniref:NAD(P)-dependent oxidoreductase n=1 Tax=Brevibacterium sp. RIT 803 TaxID=2810210 RepID=UPI00194E4557|nr:NAD(P)-dependent oxidoreductase [Brevibacterium sp. RIT 803]MBM6588882.1 hypothetical protein [Brevibacterium sp. RIT 803]